MGAGHRGVGRYDVGPCQLARPADELEIEVRQQEEEAARIKREKEEMWASFWRGKYGGDGPDPLGDVLTSRPMPLPSK